MEISRFPRRGYFICSLTIKGILISILKKVPNLLGKLVYMFILFMHMLISAVKRSIDFTIGFHNHRFFRSPLDLIIFQYVIFGDLNFFMHYAKQVLTQE